MFANMIIQAENVKRQLLQGGRELHLLKGISFSSATFRSLPVSLLDRERR